VGVLLIAELTLGDDPEFSVHFVRLQDQITVIEVLRTGHRNSVRACKGQSKTASYGVNIAHIASWPDHVSRYFS
jgi:hypothetical protein